MKVTGLAPDQLGAVVRRVSLREFDGNILDAPAADCSTRNSVRSSFSIRMCDSSGLGARRGPSGRRSVAACWHVFYRVFEGVFNANPDAVIYTPMYKAGLTMQNFEAVCGELREWNIGSLVLPLRLIDACDCECD